MVLGITGRPARDASAANALLAHRLYGHTGQLQHIGDALCGLHRQAQSLTQQYQLKAFFYGRFQSIRGSVGHD